jgi:acrylyl-CoA reductase (NADPH)
MPWRRPATAAWWPPAGWLRRADLATTVMPFILRGVTLAGVDSVMAPLARRQRAWDRLARDLDPAKLETLIEEIPLSGAIDKAHALMAGQVRGRVVVRIGG